MKIGVLALQGAVHEHIRMIEKAGSEGIVVKRPEQLDELQGLIIPGGESTTIGKLMRTYQFMDRIKQFFAEGRPIFGTCAGLIVLANEIVGTEQRHLELMDMRVSRNAFGRQRESFEADLDFDGLDSAFRAVFIRAPLIEQVGPKVDVVSTYQNKIVAAREANLLATAFHPELTDDERIHAYFINMVKENASTSV